MKKTLLMLVGALLLLTLVLLKNRGNEKSMRAEVFAFDTTQKSAVERIKITNKTDTSQLKKADGKWVMAADGFPVDTAKIRKGLNYLLGLQDKEVVSRSAARLAEYGLDTAQVKHVEWLVGGKTFKVMIGKTSGNDYSSTYWKWEDKPEVFSTPGNFTWEIGTKPADWMERSLFKVTAKDIKDLTVDWRDSTDSLFHYKLNVVNDTTIKMAEPESATVVKGLGQEILGRLADVSIDDFVAPKDSNFSKIRLDTPKVDVKINLKDGKSLELKSGKSFGNYAYTQHPFRKDVVKLSDWRFEAFKRHPDVISGKVPVGTTMPMLPKKAPIKSTKPIKKAAPAP